MMFQCINASISAKVLRKVSKDPSRYTIVIPTIPAQAQPAEIIEYY